jgi:membrane fusion protein, multidrug efflux system
MLCEGFFGEKSGYWSLARLSLCTHPKEVDMSPKPNVHLIVMGIVYAAAAAGCEGWSASAEERGAPAASVPGTKSDIASASSKVKVVDTVPLKAETYTAALEVTGKALALRESYLSLSVPGLIKKIHVRLGDRVKKGQVLLRLDRRGYQLGVQQAQAALDGANAATDQLSQEISRVDQLLQEGAAPTAAKDDLLAKDKGARAQTRAANAALEQAEKALKDSVLRAPYDGVITDLLKEEGEQAPSMPPTMLMKIVDASKLDVQVFAPEDASRFIQVGTEAEVTVDSAGIATRGKAVFVSNTIQPGARTFEVRIRIDNPDDKIKAGAFARVRLAEETRDDAILIPVSSLERDDKDEPYVFIAENGKAKRVRVELGPLEGARVLVRQGLSAGQRLITSDIANLEDGQAITLSE